MRFVGSEPKEWVAKARLRKRPNWSATRNPERLERLSESMGSAIKIDLIKGIQAFRRRIPNREVLYNAWLKGHYLDLVHKIPWEKMPEDLKGAQARFHEGFEKFSKIGVEAIPKPMRANLRYDFKNPRIQRLFDQRSGRLISDISSDSRNAINSVIHQQFVEGLPIEKAVEGVKNYIGLDQRYAKAHANFVKGLRSDKIPESRIAALSQKYYDRLLEARAKTIARTETQFIMNKGQLEVWKEGVNQNLLSQKSLKVWVVDGDPCPECDAMDGEAVPVHDVWTMEDGTVCDVPSDSHPNCMCIMTLDFGEEE